MGDRFKKAYAGYSVWLLSSNKEAVKHFGLRASTYQRHQQPRGFLSERVTASSRTQMAFGDVGQNSSQTMQGMSIAQMAYYHVASGLFDVVLAVGHEKMMENDPQGTMATVAEPYFQRPFLAGAPGIFSMQSNMHDEDACSGGEIQSYNMELIRCTGCMEDLCRPPHPFVPLFLQPCL
jgi:hypothetical protein